MEQVLRGGWDGTGMALCVAVMVSCGVYEAGLKKSLIHILFQVKTL